MGRRKIEIQPLTDDRNRTVTFVKRKAGLFKKAHELAVLCQVDISIIIVGNNNKLYEFSSVDTNEVIKAYQSTKPHESKSPANYGNYKKKKNLTSQISMNDELLDQDIDESDYDSDTPEPKRAKRNYESMKDESTINDRTKYNNNNTINSANSSNSSIINNSMVTNTNSNDTNNTNNTNDRPLPPNHISLSRIPTFNSFHNGVIKEEEEEEEENGKAGRFLPDSTVNNHSNRPILRVQIPTDAKSGNDSARTLTALETSHNTNSNLNSNLNPRPGLALDNKINGKSPTINTPKYSSFSTFRSPDIRKPITTLPLPIHSKSQTSSPSSATAPSLPRDGMTSFFNPLRQPSPTQFNNGNNTNNNSHNNNSNNPVPTPILNQALGDKLKTINQPVQGQIPQMQMSAQQMSGGPSLTGQNIPGQLPGVPGPSGSGETPVSGLPSKYVDMFPSPLGFYPQDWSNNMTPYTNMNQYFFRHPNSAQGQPSNQQQGMNYQFPSPTQFMNQFDEKK